MNDVLANVVDLTARYRVGALTPAVYATHYVLLWQYARYGNHMALRRSRRDPKPDVSSWIAALEIMDEESRRVALVDFLQRHDLRSVRRRVNDALIGWLRDAWQLVLYDRIPSAHEVLQLQTRGCRPVTVIADYPRLHQPVLDKPDAFAFICHDLEHAWQFFHDASAHQAQIGFARRLADAMARGLFATQLKDAIFAEKFDYLAADMNTHSAHSFQYLRAILIEHYLRAEGKELHQPLSDESRVALDRCLNAFPAELSGAGIVHQCLQTVGAYGL